ncbi:MAG: hypothetical protein AAFY29_19530 [Pseudomonadota bacterium]
MAYPDYPEEWEFISFFEAEPSHIDPIEVVPWFYNGPTYETQRDGYSIKFALNPASCQFELEILCNGNPFVLLSGERIESMKITTLQSTEKMVITFEERGPPYLLDLVLQLKPVVSVTWGTERS